MTESEIYSRIPIEPRHIIAGFVNNLRVVCRHWDWKSYEQWSLIKESNMKMIVGFLLLYFSEEELEEALEVILK